MNKIKIAVYISMLSCLASCKQFSKSGCESGIDIKVLNKSGSKQHIKLSTSENSFINFDIPSTAHEKDTLLCFDKNPKVDGQYILQIKSIVIDSTSYFGYYTNGYPLGSRIEITINKDRFTAKEIISGGNY